MEYGVDVLGELCSLEVPLSLPPNLSMLYLKILKLSFWEFVFPLPAVTIMTCLQAFSRRATLFEMIRDYAQAASDLERVISLLTKKLEDKNNASLSYDKINYSNELKRTQLNLSQIEEAARKKVPLNMYLIL